jgi:hypothetical protein
MLLAAIALASGCLAESADGRGVSHPMAHVADAAVCADESPTGSHIKHTVCREPPSAVEQAEGTAWRNALPASPFRGVSEATDTPGLRVYR